MGQSNSPEATIRELEQRLQLTYESVSEGVWDWDLRTDDLVWSDRFIELVGLSRDSFTPRVSTFFDRLHPDDRPRIKQALDDHLQHQKVYDVGYRLQHENGNYLHIHALGQAFWSDDGTPLRMVGSVEDITEKVTTRRALDESETRFQQLAANIPGAIFRYQMHPDGSDEIEYMSPGCLDIWEIDADAIQGDPAMLWEAIVEEDFPAMRESVVRAAETLGPWMHRWRIVTPSGRQKWLHGRAVPSKANDGSVLFNSLILDVTEQTLVEQELAESREISDRAQRLDSLGQLTGGVAHDFNNLLGIILGNLELLKDVASLGDESQYVDDALGAVYRGSELTRSLLAFARRATLEPESVAISEVVSDLAQMLRRTLPENIALHTRVDPSVPNLVIDRAALEGTLLNLIINARDAIESSGSITVCGSPFVPDKSAPNLSGKPCVRIQVSDTGSGISPDIVNRVVEPFFTTKPVNQGTGLGLSIAEGFAKQSGGELNIESEPGKGTTVAITLPAGEGEVHEKSPSSNREANETPLIQHGCILVVEDENDLRKILCNRLAAEGYTVHQASNGDKALAAYEKLEGNLDLLLTDVIMPGSKQGPDLAAEMRSLQPDIAVIYLSGYADISDFRDNKEYMRADARLQKPVGKIDLLRTVQQVLMRRAERI